MTKRISLMGAHRTGKTTLAQEYSKQEGLGMVHFSFSPSYKAFDIPVGTPVSWTMRMAIQAHALGRMQGILESTNDQSLISDRCPLDLIAYLMAEVPETLTPEENEFIEHYIVECIGLTMRHYDNVYLLRPGIPQTPDDTSWSHLSAVVNKIDTGMLWAADQSGGIVTEIPGQCLAIKDRIAFINNNN